MRRVYALTIYLLLAIFTLSSQNYSQASYEGSPDFTNDRIVPLMSSPTDLNSNGSGFLYSSRIVFTSGHTSFIFNSNGERQEFRPELSVGKPNTDIKTISTGIRVIKRIAAPSYLGNKDPDLNDFAILILERDLISAEPVQLLTPEIEQELVTKRAEVKIHGFGNTVDLCSAGENLPCNTAKFRASDVPRSITHTLRPSSDFPDLVGYQVPQRLLNQLLFFSPGKASMCGGDSGGSLTTIYNGKLLYLANIGTASGIYACGQARSFDGKGGINYSQPIYRYLDLIKEAEKFVSEQVAIEKAKAEAEAKAAAELKAQQDAKTNSKIGSTKKKTTISCVKGKIVKKITGVNPKCPSGYKKS